MITLLGALIGFISAIFPDIFKLLKGSQDNKHELAVLALQIEAAKQAGSQRLEEIGIEADVRASEALYKHAAPVGVRWVDALNSSVRPTLTYWFFLCYVTVKVAQFQALGHIDPLPWQSEVKNVQQWFNIVLQLWSDEDQALFAAVLSFWFGDRSMTKRRAGK